MTGFFQQNMFLVFFLYGLSFFLMGLSIFVCSRNRERTFFTQCLHFFAFFGLLHGSVEWMDMYQAVMAKNLDKTFLNYYVHLKLFLNVTSFYYLFRFGAGISKLNVPWLSTFVGWLWMAMFLVASGFLGLTNVGFENAEKWTIFGDITGRYMLAFPASVFACIGLLKFAEENRQTYNKGVVLALKATAGACAAYAIFGGLIVPKADYLLAGILNYPNFITWTGVPVQAIRGLIAIISMFCIVRVLEIFECEQMDAEKRETETTLGILMDRVRESAVVLADSSNQLAASTEKAGQSGHFVTNTVAEISAGFDKQAVSLQDIMAKMTQISGRINTIAADTEKAASASSDASTTASEGSQIIQKAINHIGEIEQTAQELSCVMKNLGERYNMINQFIDVISGIAAQTNLLALNAAIEAARAGEQGKGFAVVADEVRKLADESKKATEQVTEIVKQIKTETILAVGAVDKEVSEVHRGKTMFEGAGDAFHNIEELVKKLDIQIENIFNASRLITDDSESMLRNISHVDIIVKEVMGYNREIVDATGQQLASMKEIAKTSKDLSVMAEELRKDIGRESR